jgi:O-succinylhomoserine sulfhydrylase
VFFLESPTNPTLEVIDIAAVAKLANQIGAKVVVDNVFATPLQQKPLELGAHVVVYSATKHIDGQGRCLGGVVLSDKEWIDENLHDYLPPHRPGHVAVQCLDLLKGLETLPLRVKQQTENAARSPTGWRNIRPSPASSIPAARIIRRPTSSPEADDRRLDADLLRR